MNRTRLGAILCAVVSGCTVVPPAAAPIPDEVRRAGHVLVFGSMIDRALDEATVRIADENIDSRVYSPLDALSPASAADAVAALRRAGDYEPVVILAEADGAAAAVSAAARLGKDRTPVALMVFVTEAPVQGIPRNVKQVLILRRRGGTGAPRFAAPDALWRDEPKVEVRAVAGTDAARDAAVAEAVNACTGAVAVETR